VARHGSRGRYNQGCRCSACWAANADAAQAWRDRRRQHRQDEPGFQGDPRFQPPKLQAPLRPLQERAAEESAAAAAVRGQSESAQRQRDRHKANELAAELLDREDQLRPAAKRPAAAAYRPPGVVDAPWWKAAAALRAQPARPTTLAVRPVAPKPLGFLRGPAAAGAAAPSAADLFADARKLLQAVSRGGSIDLQRHGALAMMARSAALDPCIRQAVGGPVADRALAVVNGAVQAQIGAALDAGIYESSGAARRDRNEAWWREHPEDAPGVQR
jgi:hypothetical protein